MENVPSELSEHRTLIETQQLGPRRSTRFRVAPTWLKDFVQPRSTRVQQEISHSSQSHSLHSATIYPLLQTEDLSHLSQDFASLMSVT